MLTSEDLNRRKHYLGSSDIAAILGLSDYKNVADVYFDKINTNIEIDPPSAAAALGSHLEGFLLSWAFAQGWLPNQPVEANKLVVHQNSIMACQIDGWLPESHEIIECKTSGLVAAPGWRPDAWGPAGTDYVPAGYICQVQHQMACSGAEVAHVAAFLGAGIGPRYYRIERNNELIAKIEQIAVAFWQNHVLKRVPPPDSIASIEVLKKAHREAGKTTLLNEALIDDYLFFDDVAKKAIKDLEAQKALIIQTLTIDNADQGVALNGQATYFANKNGARTLRVKGVI